MTTIIETVLLFVFLFAAGLARYYMAKYHLQTWIEELCVKAEAEYQSTVKKGKEKKKEVIDQAYCYIPNWLTPFITRELLGEMVDECVEQMNKFAKTKIDKVIMGYTE